MAKQGHDHHNPDQRTFGFVRGHDRFRLGRPERVSAHWRRLPGPLAAPRPERDENPRVAPLPVITLSVTVTVSVSL